MIDDKSLEILRIIQQKARIPNIEVSRQVGLAPSAVLERIRKMEKQGIIDGYEVRLNPERFDCAQLAFIKVQATASDCQKVGEKLAQIPVIQEVHFVAGEDCYLIKIRTRNPNSLGQLLCEHIQAIQGVVATQTMTVLSTVKETSRIQIQHLP